MTAEQLLQMMAAIPSPKSVAEMRQLIDQFFPLLNHDLPTIGALHENVVLRTTEGTLLTADVAVPLGNGPHPVLLYLHGGGWSVGSPQSHRKLGMQFAEAGYLTFNLDYRLAPEHPFPAGVEDCVFAVSWVRQNAARYGGNPARLTIGGDSAGANLAAATCVTLNGGVQHIAAALLIYGAFDLKSFLAGDLNMKGAEPLSRELVLVLTEAYLGKNPGDAVLTDPRVSPLYTIPKGFPPCFIICGSLDPLLPQSRQLAQVCREQGIPHDLHVIDGMPHGFLQMSMLPECVDGFDRAVRFLQKHV